MMYSRNWGYSKKQPKNHRMLWADILHLCQQPSLPGRLEDDFTAAVTACDKQFLLRCLMSAAQYGNAPAVSIINKIAQDRTYNTTHTALSTAIEYRQEAAAKILLPTEACVTKITTAMSRVIMGDQLYNVETQIASSKESCFKELSERDVAGRNLAEYCVIFRRKELLMRIMEQITAFNLDPTLLCTFYHEPVIFLAIRANDLETFTTLYHFCCYHGLDRNIDNQSLGVYAAFTGASAITQWISKHGSSDNTTQPPKLCWLRKCLDVTPITKARKNSVTIAESTNHCTALSKVSGRSQFGDESTSQQFSHTFTLTVAKNKAVCFNERLDSLMSILSYGLGEYATEDYNSTLDHDSYIDALNLSYSDIAYQLALIDGNHTLRENVRSFLYAQPMTLNIVHASSYSGTLHASHMSTNENKPILAELSAVKIYDMYPIFSISIIIKPPGTVIVQDALLESEKALGLTPFSDPRRFMKLNPVGYDSALTILEWFLSATANDLNNIFLHSTSIVDIQLDQSGQPYSIVQLETGIDLVVHRGSPYFEATAPCGVECRTDDGRPLVLTNFSNGMKEIATHMKDRYIFTSDCLVMGLRGNYAHDLFKLDWRWPRGSKSTLCTKHASSRCIYTSTKQPICAYANIERLLRYTRRRIAGRQKV